MQIDQNATATDLFAQWDRGDRAGVIGRLEGDHPGLTALFLVVGRTQRRLSAPDAKAVMDLLVRRRTEALAKGEGH
jgi:hypothetical protein